MLQNKYCIILPIWGNNWLTEGASSLLKVVPSELNNHGRTELVTLLQFCITRSLNLPKFQGLLKNILIASEKDDKTVRILVIQLILKAVQLSMYSPNFLIPVDFLKMMREISPTEVIVNFTPVMMLYVGQILQVCKNTGYVEEMVDILSYEDLEGLFIGDVVNGVVAMTTRHLHPINSKVTAYTRIVPLQIFCATFTSLIQLGFNIDGETFTNMNDFQTREVSKMGNEEKISFRDMMSATVEKWGESLSTKIGLDVWKNLLKDEQFDENGSLANAILTSIPFSDETWDFILHEVVWKETPSREDNIYRALVTLANNSKFPRSRVTNLLNHCYNTLLPYLFHAFLVAWVNDKKNENISPEVELILKYGTQYRGWIDQWNQQVSYNLLALLRKFVPFYFIRDFPADLRLFFDLHESLITRAKGGTFSSVYWVKWMIWQIIFVFGVNIAVEYNLGLINKVDPESVRLGVELLLDFPMEKGTSLEVEESQVTIIGWQLNHLKGAGWVTEEIKGDIGKVQDKIGKVCGKALSKLKGA
ncbi:hypothetical protein Fcan01_20238 [Folsomia candida]|uniref:Uncharacterized protein n=1 Tax=Folsomia candida TaxID=158441 RepID=A0A226DJ56_FOLCA|nr:hypothetical protein Fcan01_20238 [Folsomia candida]